MRKHSAWDNKQVRDQEVYTAINEDANAAITDGDMQARKRIIVYTMSLHRLSQRKSRGTCIVTHVGQQPASRSYNSPSSEVRRAYGADGPMRFANTDIRPALFRPV